MELFEIQNMMQRGEKPKFLIFVGTDYEVANTYIKNLSQFYKLERSSLEDLSRLPALCVGDQMFSEDKLFVMKYPKDLSSYEKIFERINDILGDNMLIIVLTDIDKRTKFYTQNKDVIVNCDPQDLKVFRTMVAPLTKLSSDGVKELAEICGNNYGKFLTEIDKVQNYSQSKGISEDEALKHLIATGVIYTANKDVIFEFVGRVLSAKNNMYELYNVLKLQEESNIKVVSLLYTAFRNQFMCETVVSATQDTTGLAPFIISQCLKRKGTYSQGDLRKALKLLMDVEQGVKSGLFEEKQIIDYFLAELLL